MGQQRPTGVSLIAIWYFLCGLSIFGGGLAPLFPNLLPLAFLATFNPLLIGVGGVLIGALYFAIAWGLWEAQNWARLAAIILAALSLITFLFLGATFLFGVNVGGLTASLPGLGIGFIVIAAIEGVIVYYLLQPEAEQFFSGSGAMYGAIAAEATVASAPTPMPVTTAPPPLTPAPVMPSVQAPAALPRTDIIGAPQPASAWLVARNGPRPGKEYGLQRRDNVIGRDGTQCDIVLDDTAVSKQHAKVKFENGQFVVVDLGSTNGTFVNNRRVQRQSLLDGDDVRFGNTTFVFKEVRMRR